ncbi:hypothetical protein ACFX10_011527 [Malus domestica]
MHLRRPFRLRHGLRHRCSHPTLAKLSLNQPWPRCSTTSVRNQISRSPRSSAIVEVNTLEQAKLAEDASAYSIIVFDPLHNPRSVYDEMTERQLGKERIREEIIAGFACTKAGSQNGEEERAQAGAGNHYAKTL